MKTRDNFAFQVNQPKAAISLPISLSNSLLLSVETQGRSISLTCAVKEKEKRSWS